MTQAKKFTAGQFDDVLEQAKEDVRKLMIEFAEGAVGVINQLDRIKVGVLGETEERSSTRAG